MRVIIAGSRSLYPVPEQLDKIIEDSGFIIKEIISGGASGVDSAAISYGHIRGYKFKVFKAEWDKYGKSAGYKRNVIMADNADALIAIWDGISKGTSHMINIAKEKGLKIYVKRYNK